MLSCQWNYKVSCLPHLKKNWNIALEKALTLLSQGQKWNLCWIKKDQNHYVVLKKKEEKFYCLLSKGKGNKHN